MGSQGANGKECQRPRPEDAIAAWGLPDITSSRDRGWRLRSRQRCLETALCHGMREGAGESGLAGGGSWPSVGLLLLPGFAMRRASATQEFRRAHMPVLSMQEQRAVAGWT